MIAVIVMGMSLLIYFNDTPHMSPKEQESYEYLKEECDFRYISTDPTTNIELNNFHKRRKKFCDYLKNMDNYFKF
jgi:hypothetical protein